MSATPRPDQPGDGSARADLERERDQALADARAKSDFLTRVTHELRTPVSGIIGMIDLAADDTDAGDRQAHLASARASARHLLELIDDLLDTSREDAWRFNVVEITFSLDEVLEQALAMVAPRAQRKGITVAGELAPGLAIGRRGDPLRLRQILVNLLYNAVKFTEQGGVRARIDAAGPRQITITVEDTGIGIGPELQATVFEPHVRGGIGEGFGLGLAITRELVVALGGTISFRSTPGVGTCFTVVLPLREATAERGTVRAAEAAGDAGEASVRPLSVLIVEDYPINAEILQAILERAGHRVEVTGTGGGGIAAAARGGLDVALMDLELPDLDGASAVRAIRAAEHRAGGRRLPILGVSAHRDRALVAAAAGMDGYLSKPVDAIALAAELARLTADDWRPPIDHETRLGRVGGRRELATTIVHTFLGHAGDLLDPVDRAIDGASEEGVRQAAHGLRPALLMIGALSAADLAAELERGSLDRARPLRAALAFELARAIAELQLAVAG